MDNKSENIELTLEDYEDLKDLREAKKESIGQESVSFDKVVSDLCL